MDKCTECGHAWHGLPCTYYNEFFNHHTGEWQRNECQCPSSFKEE